MTTSRKFCRFIKPKGIEIPLSLASPPDGGFCLSAFLVITKTGHRNHVLMGHLNPDAEWDHIGGLGRERALTISKNWMLPSCHLIYKESPQQAAQRLLSEQIGIEKMQLKGPQIFSEAWDAVHFNLIGHWDLEFVFTGALKTEPKSRKVWKELKFVNLKETKKEEMARSHEDILGHVGLRLG